MFISEISRAAGIHLIEGLFDCPIQQSVLTKIFFSIIDYYLDLLKIFISFEFVEGHKYDNRDIHKLDSPALANIQAVLLATAALLSAKPSSSVLFFPANVYLLSINNIPIT